MKLSVEGYKSIASRQELRFDGLTILSGANSSGKSSFMQPFLVLKQTIENHYDAGSLVLYGENAKLTDSSQLISKVPGYDKNRSAYQCPQTQMVAPHLINTKEALDFRLTVYT